MLHTVISSKNTKLTKAWPICVCLPGRAGDGLGKEVTLELFLSSAESVGWSPEKGSCKSRGWVRAWRAEENRHARARLKQLGRGRAPLAWDEPSLVPEGGTFATNYCHNQARF